MIHALPLAALLSEVCRDPDRMHEVGEHAMEEIYISWKDAVKKHELPWLHVYNTKTSTVLADYGIQGFPTKIIIDPEGKIVKTIVGEDPAFYTLLDELFK